MRMRKGILSVLILLALANTVHFVNGIPIFLSSVGDPPQTLPVRAQRVNVLIDNGYVMTNVSQEFYNPSDTPVHGNYLFAIPEDAFISNFSLTIKGIKYYGEILPRDQASEQYQEAVEAGRTAALLEYVG